MVGRPTVLAVVVSVLTGAALSWGGTVNSFEEDLAGMTGLIDLIANRVGEVESLLARSRRESTALRTSCIEEKLQQLRDKKRLAGNDAATFRGLRDNPAEQKRLVEHSRLLEVFS